MTSQEAIDLYIKGGLDAVNEKFIGELMTELRKYYEVIQKLEKQNEEYTAAIKECGTCVTATSNLYKNWMHLQEQDRIYRYPNEEHVRYMREAFAKFEQDLKGV